MTEAQPSKKVGGHTYGRRHRQVSNTAEEGELCLYTGHAIGRFSSHSMRYDSHQACTRCVAAAREGRMSLTIDSLLKKNRIKALKFWSQVDIGSPDVCWPWNGCINSRTMQPQFAWRRHGISTSTQHHPQRVAMWFSWGDLGFTGVKTTCGEKYCCNPFHLIPQHIGVFVDQDSYTESFEIACQLHTLKQQVAEFVLEEAMKKQEEEEKAMDNSLPSNHDDILMNPNSPFGERFDAAIAEMLTGKHSMQITPDDPTLSNKPTDNNEEENGEPF